MMFNGGKKVLKEPETTSYRWMVAESILEGGIKDFNDHLDKDTAVEFWLTSELNWEQIQEAVKQIKEIQKGTETKGTIVLGEKRPEENTGLLAEQEKEKAYWEESRKQKLDYVR